MLHWLITVCEPTLTLSVYPMIEASECCGKCACIDGCHAWTWSKTTKICYPKGATGWTKDKRDNVVSGVTLQRYSSNKFRSQGEKFWDPSLNVGDHTLKSFGKDISTNSRADNKYVVRDPTCNSSEPVVRAMYQKVRYFRRFSSNVLFMFL